MRAVIHFLSRIRLVYCRSSLLLKCAVLAAILLSTAALLAIRGAIAQEQNRYDQAREEAAALEQDNRRILESISQVGTLQGIRRIAAEEFGLADSDTVIFVPEN